MNDYNNKEVQLVSFAAAYPADYGGVIDVYYKLKTMHQMGIKVHLHTYVYGTHQKSKELESLCASVQYYKRDFSSKYFQGWPYIVSTRYNKKMIRNIVNLGFPVILEGLHTCFLVDFLKEKSIPYVVRMHNIEWKYYQFLAQVEASFVKKKYFLEEARRLRSYEKVVQSTKILAISAKDRAYFKESYPQAEVIETPPFHQFEHLEIQSGRGEYALFHGNLSVNENEQAAIWLIEKVFLKLNFPLIIAGKNPTEKLLLAANASEKIEIIANSNDQKMNDLMKNAHIQVIPNKQPTGVKIKWLNSLFAGRFIIVHPDIYPETVKDSGIYSIESNIEMMEKVKSLSSQDFTEEIIENRRAWMKNKYDNENNMINVIKLLIV
ncbi:MAG TPA: hypothetical protein VLZ75_00425 [Chitinophagales bacterium]|nr:hypothetical protein [Chitinophagales bacterium]